MKRPSFQFYPGDWQANSNLRRCSHAEKGAWVDVMCLLHDQPEYGVLRWPLKEIAQAIGCNLALLRGIAAKEVLKGSDTHLAEPFVYVPRSGRRDGEPVILLPKQPGPIWYSSRMVRDEYIRTVRGESTRFGEGGEHSKGSSKPPPKTAPKASPKPPLGDGSSSSSSSSSSIALSAHSATSTEVGAGDPGFAPTKAGEVGMAVKRAGLDPTRINLSDPVLAELLRQGAQPEEFEGLAREAVDRQIRNPWPWVLKAVQGRRADAAAIQLAPKPVDPMAWRNTTDGVFAMGEQLGVRLMPTEDYGSYERRVLTAFQRRQPQESAA